MNFQMFKLDLEKAEESEIKLPTSAGSQKKQEDSRKPSTSASLIKLKPLTVWITTKWKIKEMLTIWSLVPVIFYMHLEHLELLSSHTVEAYLEGI